MYSCSPAQHFDLASSVEAYTIKFGSIYAYMQRHQCLGGCSIIDHSFVIVHKFSTCSPFCVGSLEFAINLP